MIWIALLTLPLVLRVEALRGSMDSSSLARVQSSSTVLEMTGDPSGSAGKGFGRSIPRPKVITPSQGKVNPELEKFLMMYTCAIFNSFSLYSPPSP